jgi:hypothetical protein
MRTEIWTTFGLGDELGRRVTDANSDSGLKQGGAAIGPGPSGIPAGAKQSPMTRTESHLRR